MPPEDQRWKALRAGEIEAFTELYKAYYQFLFSHGYRGCGNKDLAKDCIHELFLEIWNNHSNLPQVYHVGYYLRTILQRKLAREIQKSPGSSFDEHSEKEVRDFQLSYEDLLIQLQSKEEMKEKVRKAILQLSPRQLEIIRMKFFEDKTYDEIAAITAVSPRTIYNQVYRALHTLRNCLKILMLLLK
jgi:RNA polymerase sigma-70 factor (ECF subfamily)